MPCNFFQKNVSRESVFFRLPLDTLVNVYIISNKKILKFKITGRKSLTLIYSFENEF